METLILLPNKISILRDRENQDIGVGEEYSIYFSNIIYPFRMEYDIQIDCKYGMNLDRCWRITNFDGIDDTFKFVISVYAPYGELVAKKECTINIVSPEKRTEFSILCIGDSITRGELYIEHMTHKALGAVTVGSRRVNYNVHHEGRGGWTYNMYYNCFYDCSCGVSPFMFPENVSGEEYYGDVEYWQNVKINKNKYHYIGMPYTEIQDGMYCLKNKTLCQYSRGEYIEIEKNPRFEFNFEKYLKRFNIEKPDIISLLFGANDLQMCHYSQTEEEVKKYIEYTRFTVRHILKLDASVIINLPILGADQYSWGIQNGCRGTSKNYEYNIKMAVKALIDEFDGREAEGIYLCPMIAVVDPLTGFTRDASFANIYSDSIIEHNNNWVHPNETGHKQMGDALAATCIQIIDSK